MSQIIVGNKNNIFTSTFVASTKTLSIANCNNFPLDLASLVSVYDTTTGSAFNMLQPITFSWDYVNSQPVFTWVFTTVPAGVANSDTLIITLEVPQNQMEYSAQLVVNAATI